ARAASARSVRAASASPPWIGGARADGRGGHGGGDRSRREREPRAARSVARGEREQGRRVGRCATHTGSSCVALRGAAAAAWEQLAAWNDRGLLLQRATHGIGELGEYQ